MRFIFYFSLPSRKPTGGFIPVSHNDFYYGRTKNFGFCVLILKQNKKRKKNATNTYFIKIYFLKNIQAGHDKETEQSWFVGVFILRFSCKCFVLSISGPILIQVFIVKIFVRLQGVVTLAALYNLSIIIIRLTFSDMAANVSPKEHLKWIQCQSINMSIISRVLLALCNACIIGVNSNTFRNSTLTLILINLFKIHAWKKLNLCCGFRLNIFTLA